jgi:flagella basal body P-ring formation protein FlgA
MLRRTVSNNLNLEGIKDIALKRATAKTYFAISLLALSLFAAFAITGQANKSVKVWTASKDLAAGDVIKIGSTSLVKVFLPVNSSQYLNEKSKIVDLVVTRRMRSSLALSRVAAAA